MLSPAGLAAATRSRFRGLDDSFNLPADYGAGFRLADPDYGPHASAGTFGHAGWGGSFAFGDPEARLGFAFVTNNMLGFDDADPRRTRLIQAVSAAL